MESLKTLTVAANQAVHQDAVLAKRQISNAHHFVPALTAQMNQTKMKLWKVKKIRTVMRMSSQHTMMSLDTIEQNLPPHIFTVSTVSIRLLGWALLYNASNFEENFHDSTIFSSIDRRYFPYF